MQKQGTSLGTDGICSSLTLKYRFMLGKKKTIQLSKNTILPNSVIMDTLIQTGGWGYVIFCALWRTEPFEGGHVEEGGNFHQHFLLLWLLTWFITLDLGGSPWCWAAVLQASWPCATRCFMPRRRLLYYDAATTPSDLIPRIHLAAWQLQDFIYFPFVHMDSDLIGGGHAIFCAQVRQSSFCDWPATNFSSTLLTKCPIGLIRD